MIARSILPLLLMFSLAAQGAESLRTDYHPLFEKLRDTPKASSLARAFAGFVLEEDGPAANAHLETAFQEALGEHDALSPIIADEQFKWQMRTWVRLYYLFGPHGAARPGALSEANVDRIETLFWNYALAKSTVARADTKYVWFIQGSENHDLMDLGNAFLAIQALAQRPAWAPRTLSDGRTLADHRAAWTAYFNRYCIERFRHGLFIEFGSPIYGKYLIPELVNLLDFSEDPRLQHNARALLDLCWADWAVEQLKGIRGGAKARCYQGKYSQFGARDSWYMMGNLLLKQNGWDEPGNFTHPIMGFGLVLATSDYTLPPLIARLATETEQRGDYAYQSRRPGRMTHVDPQPPKVDHSCWYNFARESRFIRYTWSTPDHILGSYTLDPALREDYQIYPAEPERADGRYAAISTQNLWQGLTFNTGPDARIYFECEGKVAKNDPAVSTTYVQHIAVQHENVLLLQANRNYPPVTGLKICFATGMNDRLIERKGWHILEEGDSYAAFRIFHQTDNRATWLNDRELRTGSAFDPVALVTGRKATFATLDAFANYLDGHTWAMEDGQLTYRFPDRSGTETRLGLFLKEARVPLKNGDPVDLEPRLYYNNPFFKENAERNTVRITFGGESYEIALQQ